MIVISRFPPTRASSTAIMLFSYILILKTNPIGYQGNPFPLNWLLLTSPLLRTCNMFQPTYLFYAVSCLLLAAVYQLYPFLLHILRRTALRGPRASNFVFGSRDLFLDPQMDDVSLYENWASQYGSVFQIPAPFGSRKVVLCDPKAVAHFYSLETIVYGRDSVRREQMSKFVFTAT